MKIEHLLFMTLAVVILLPTLKFIFTRVLLIQWLSGCKRKSDVDDYFFYNAGSMFSGTKGKHSDLIIIIRNKIIVVKLIGGLRSKIIYEINNQQDWNLRYFIPLPLPVIIDREGIKKEISCKFDLVKEKSVLQSKLWNLHSNYEIEIAYFFNPVPLSVKEMVYKKEKELYGGDICYGIRILTRKTLLNTYGDNTKKAISKDEIMKIKAVYRNRD